MPAYGPRRPKPINGEFQSMNEEQARRCIAYVNRGRQLLAERVRSIVLFGEKRNTAKKNDHPMVQVLYELRDKYEKMKDETDQDSVDTQINVLTKMFTFAKDLTQEGNKASVEIQQMLHARIEIAQRQKEHQDKMDLARKASGQEPSAQELAQAVGDSMAIPWKSTAASNSKALGDLDLPPELEALTAEGRKNNIGPIDVDDE